MLSSPDIVMILSDFADSGASERRKALARSKTIMRENIFFLIKPTYYSITRVRTFPFIY